jgi:methyl-accepting chemotaxis protein
MTIMKLSIRTKLFSSFFCIILLLVILGIISILRMNALQSRTDIIASNWLPNIVQISLMKDELAEVRTQTYKILFETKIETREANKKTISSSMENLSSLLKTYDVKVSSPEERIVYDTANSAVSTYLTHVPEIITAGLTNEQDVGLDLIDKAIDDRKKATAALETLIQYNTKGAKTEVDQAAKENSSGRVIIIVIGLLAILISSVLALIISQGVAGSVSKLLALMVKMAGGDLRENINIKSRDEFSTLAGTVNDMIASLRKLIGGTVLSAQSVAAASQEISATTEQIASGSQSQAVAAQTMNELTQDLVRAIDEVARNAEAASELSRQTKLGAEEGGKAVRDSSVGMAKLSEKMELLEQDSQKIGEIIEVIDEIAEQTNLLALNAAIEAARAGEQGRGFAVVADEVRKLAERSSEATKQIAHIIRGMQQNTVLSVQAVGEASSLSDKTGDLIQNIVGLVNSATQQMTGIAAACEEQAAQSNEVLRSIESIAAASQESAAAAEETAASSQMLAKLADELNYSVATFKV